MKSFRINLEDGLRLGIVHSRSIGRGRLKNGVKRKRIGKLGVRDVGSKFYLKIANLKKEEISDFIREYQIILPWMIEGRNLATEKDIIKFQKDLRQIIQSIKLFKKIHRNMALTHFFLGKKFGDILRLINKYLKDCYLAFNLSPVISDPLSESDLKSYHSQLDSFTAESSGFLNDNVLKRNDLGANFSNLMCRCNSLLSWCVLDLLIDRLIRNELIRICKNCSRVFKAETQKSEYCSNDSCQVNRMRKRKQKSRQKIK